MKNQSTTDEERGSRLRKLRRSKDWTQQELAEKINRSFHAISKYEQGLPLSKDVVYRLAEVLGTTENYILKGIESRKENNHTEPINNQHQTEMKINEDVKLLNSYEQQIKLLNEMLEFKDQKINELEQALSAREEGKAHRSA